MHYIQRSELVHPATAALLDRAFEKDVGLARCCQFGSTVPSGVSSSGPESAARTPLLS
jgi:hypothetical protein